MSTFINARLRQAGRALAGFLLGVSLWIPAIALPTRPALAHTPEESMSELKVSNVRWIEVNLSTQRLIAWQGRDPIYAVIVSTGTYDHPTLTGTFAIQSMHEVARMQGDDYDIDDVPYVMYYDGNYGIHGTYWHSNFGTPMSHGCVNVAVDHAEWLFYWASIGTPVVVHY
jgi:lipoprotein-anchoring transpeptidase ErfK/SrfK